MKKFSSLKELFLNRKKLLLKSDISARKLSLNMNSRIISKNFSSPLLMKDENSKILKIIHKKEKSNLSSIPLSSTKSTINTKKIMNKKKKKNKYFFLKHIPKEDYLSSYNKIPEIIKINKKLLKDAIYKEQNEIDYSKKNFSQIHNYYLNKKENDRRISLLFSDLFDKRKKGEEIKFKKIPFNNIKDTIEDYNVSNAKNIYDEFQNKLIQRKSLNMSKLYDDFFINENQYFKENNKLKGRINYLFLKQQIKFQNLLKHKINFKNFDVDVFEVLESTNNIKDDNLLIEASSLHSKKFYPKYVKTRFKSNTLSKFITSQGNFFGIP